MKVIQVYNRVDTVYFIGLTLNATVFQRMKGFTDGGRSLNASTYDRRYIDEKTERSDVIAYATEIAYGFDRIKGDAVTEMLAKVHTDELVGFTRPIVTVNFNEPVEGGGFKAKMRNWSVQPDSDRRLYRSIYI